jgi:hypothetical protein
VPPGLHAVRWPFAQCNDMQAPLQYFTVLHLGHSWGLVVPGSCCEHPAQTSVPFMPERTLFALLCLFQRE